MMLHDKTKIYIWNMIGGIVNSTISIISVMVIIRLTNTYYSGLFSLGFANAMLLQHVGSFDSRSHQCADAKSHFTFSEYLSFRLLTCGLMVIATAAFILLNHYSADRALITALLALFCVFTNISDIFQGLAQKNERLDISGQSMSIRTIGGLLLMTALLVVTKNLYISVIGLILAQIAVILFFDIPKTKAFSDPHLNFSYKQMKLLFVQTFPLFLSLFLQAYIYNMPKYAIDHYLSLDAQAIYGILFMPASIISLFGSFIFRPVLTHLSSLWSEKQYLDVIKMCLSRIAVLLVLTLMLATAGFFVGTQVLSLLYTLDLSQYRSVLVIILIGGGVTGVSSLLYFMATAMQKQYRMLLCYLVSFIASIMVSFPLVKRWGLMGAAWSYLLSCVILNISIIALMFITTKRAVKAKNNA
ncbi:oligosaccharide flippase family protein [Oscillospiraceae bacterium HV4-5-C5C]|nr:oligosaccharide flippase family protein [Oscillospiraceae bacterium HV4-5-C5C]